MLILGQRHLEKLLAGYLAHCNQHRPHRTRSSATARSRPRTRSSGRRTRRAAGSTRRADP
jgi:hypothetical protein